MRQRVAGASRSAVCTERGVGRFIIAHPIREPGPAGCYLGGAKRHVTYAGDAESRWFATIRELAARTLGPGAADLYLYGSRARGTARRASDIDIAVDPRVPLPIGALPRFREALEESTIPVRVDVVDLGEVGPAFRARVLEEGVRWTVSKNA